MAQVSPQLRLVRPPRDYSGIGEAMVRLAELAAAVHAAQAVRGCAQACPSVPGTRLRLVGGPEELQDAPAVGGQP